MRIENSRKQHQQDKSVPSIEEYARILDEFEWMYKYTEDMKQWKLMVGRERYLRQLWEYNPLFETMFREKESQHTHPRTSPRSTDS